MTGALYSAVAGLRSHMSKLNVIGNNIANVNTYSYKTTRMTFTESISTTARAGVNSAGMTTGGLNPTQYGYGAVVASVDVNMASSTYSPTGYALDCMIAGDGFFLVGDKTGTFSSVGDISSLSLTRMGDFRPDSSGYITDSAGNVVYGFAMVQNPNYNPNATADEILKDPSIIEPTILSTDLVPLRYPLAAAAPTYENGGITVSYTIPGTDEGDDATTVYFDPNYEYEEQTLLDETGKAVVDEDGNEIKVTGVSAFKMLAYTLGIASEYEEAYTVLETENWKEGAAVYDYLSSPDTLNGNASYNTDTLPYYDENDVLQNSWGGISFKSDDTGVTTMSGYPLGYGTSQMVSNINDYQVSLSSLSVSGSGMITATNSVTGEPVVVGYVAIGSVDNTSGVTNTGGHYYSAMGGAGNLRVSIAGGIADGMYLANKAPTEDPETGELIYAGISDLDAIGNAGGSTIESNGLEASSVDLAVEMSELITTQRGYQANTRIVTVTDSMLEELVNLKR